MAILNIKSFPEDLYQVLAHQAKLDRRSITSEVIFLLQWALEESKKEKSSILQLRGLGKKDWENVNITKHIENERDSWE